MEASLFLSDPCCLSPFSPLSHPVLSFLSLTAPLETIFHCWISTQHLTIQLTLPLKPPPLASTQFYVILSFFSFHKIEIIHNFKTLLSKSVSAIMEDIFTLLLHVQPVSSPGLAIQVRTTETEMDMEKGKEKYYSSHIVSLFSILSDSHGPRTRNIKSIGNLNNIWPIIRGTFLF
jgi:hypothetical protein